MVRDSYKKGGATILETEGKSNGADYGGSAHSFRNMSELKMERK